MNEPLICFIHACYRSNCEIFIHVCFILPCFTLIDQNVKIQSSGKNDRLLSGDIKYIGLLQTFSPLKPSSYTSAISKSNQQTT